MKNTDSQQQYGFNDRVPIASSIVLALQFLIANMISIIFVVLIASAANIPSKIETNMISISLLVLAIVNIFQTIPRLGSGVLLPPSIAPPYIAQSIIALKTGGIPLLLGMTLFAGIIQAGFSLIISVAKKFFTHEIAALAILMIGVELTHYGFRAFMVAFSQTTLVSHGLTGLYHCLIFLPLVLLILLCQYGHRHTKTYYIVISVIISYIVFSLLHFFPDKQVKLFQVAHWFYLPHLIFGAWSFSKDLAISFVLGAIICAVKLSGSIMIMQDLQPDSTGKTTIWQVAKGNFWDGMGTILGGLFGCPGVNASSSAIALELSKGIMSKYIAYPLAVMLLILAFSQKLSYIFLMMPQAIVAAVLLELGVALIMSSVKVITEKATTLPTQLYLGIAFTVSLSQEFYPSIFSQLPNSIKLFTGSSIAIALLLAIILRLIFRFVISMQRKYLT